MNRPVTLLNGLGIENIFEDFPLIINANAFKNALH